MCCMAARPENEEKEFFVVGTAKADPEEPEPKEGRLLVFMVIEGKLELASESRAKGGVYDIEDYDGRVLAGVNSRIWLYKWTASEDGLWQLQQECSRHGHIIALYVKVQGDLSPTLTPSKSDPNTNPNGSSLTLALTNPSPNSRRGGTSSWSVT